jgi:tetratricopeptide (TPR) repeat protein
VAGVPPQILEPVSSSRRNALIVVSLAAACFSLATALQPRATSWSSRGDSDNILKVLLGDGRRLFADYLFEKADVYFHSGYYPSIFDHNQTTKDKRYMTAEEGSPAEKEHEESMKFLGPPRDWIERFGRHFLITEHTHLASGNEREILPWLRRSAELDPQRIDTYTVAAYWLREMGKVSEAEQFLREGLRVNPGSYEILFELGRLYWINYHDARRARNVWQLALRRWQEQEPGKKEPDFRALSTIADYLARLEESEGNLEQAITYLELARKTSPVPGPLQEQIDELKGKLSACKPATPTSRHPGRN